MENNATINANLDTGSLDLMHDIIVPPAVSFFPMASGWTLVLALLLAFVSHQGWQAYRLYQKNLYRREAMQELAAVKNRDDSEQVNALLGLMKRVALQHFGRERVAALSHDAWWDFMESHSKVKINADLRNYCQEALYAPNVKADTSRIKALEKMSSLWIKTHQGGVE